MDERQASLIEKLKMSDEHIAALDRQLAVLRLEKNTLMQVLVDELNAKDESLRNSKLEQLRLARSLQTIMGKLAARNEVVSKIRLGIKEFERDLAEKAPLLGCNSSEGSGNLTLIQHPNHQAVSK